MDPETIVNRESTPLSQHYEGRLTERDRLRRREGQLEFERTRELLLRFLPNTPAKIIDIGGGMGAYAQWLASLGYDVHLVDLVPVHVEEAARIGTFTAAVGDARALDEPAESHDVALLLGPAYHLQEAEDRSKVFREAARVVRQGGLIVAGFISRGAVALDGYVKGWIDQPGALGTMRDQLRQGFKENEGSGFSAISYFHLPSEARRELKSSGLKVMAMFGIEGPGWIAPDFDLRWKQTETRETMLETARYCEDVPELQVLSAHLLAVCRHA